MKELDSHASFQFMRQGYFCFDSKDSKSEHLVFNRTVSLKDSFKKNDDYNDNLILLKRNITLNYLFDLFIV